MSTAGSYMPPAPPLPQAARARAITGADGRAVLAWPEGLFTASSVVTLAIEDDEGALTARIDTATATQADVAVVRSAGVPLLGIGVLAVGAPAAEVTVHAIAVAAPDGSSRSGSSAGVVASAQ
jgi:hypothetical protein